MHVFLIGFPKGGTSTIDQSLRESGFKTAHWKHDERFIGELIYEAIGLATTRSRGLKA